MTPPWHVIAYTCLWSFLFAIAECLSACVLCVGLGKLLATIYMLCLSLCLALFDAAICCFLSCWRSFLFFFVFSVWIRVEILFPQASGRYHNQNHHGVPLCFLYFYSPEIGSLRNFAICLNGGPFTYRVLVQILCSYVTLPLYALVTQVTILSST